MLRSNGRRIERRRKSAFSEPKFLAQKEVDFDLGCLLPGKVCLESGIDRAKVILTKKKCVSTKT